MKRISIAAIAAAFAAAVFAAAAGATPIYMANATHQGDSALQPPPVCCAPAGPPVAGEPAPVNMAYFGGHIQVSPKIYLVLWGWGQTGAFDHTTPGQPTNDPDGAGQRMIDFLGAMGGTSWAGVSTQYYQVENGVKTYIQNPTNVLKGVWWDDTNPIHDNVSGLELAQEAQRAAAHFGVTDLHDSQFVIAQPQKYNEAGFNSGAGYCAWHDYTQAPAYPGVEPGLSFTNMPYVLNSGTSCGENSVNSGFYTGRLDGFSIVLGHEVEETITDPGAEDVINGVDLGGWYDYAAYENGDKCAWVGYTEGIAAPSTVPGGLNDITGSDGKQYAVQSLWSNNSAAGAGWCAGANDDLPGTG